MMKVIETDMEGLLVLEPKVHKDSRGYFYESFHQERMEQLGIKQQFIQDNQSRSVFGVIRGLHYQKDPFAQAKLVRVTEGNILDVALDIRPGSPSYGKCFAIELSEENFLQLMIPEGFAHGFSVLSEKATLQYKCSQYYHPEYEAGIRFDDPDLQIDWKVEPRKAIVSDKDRMLPYLKQI